MDTGGPLLLLLLSVLLVFSNGSSMPNPFQVMNNVMRRMRAEMDHVANTERVRRINQFKEHVGHVVRVHLVVGGAAPPPAVVARLQGLMLAQAAEMETHMRALLASVSNSLGRGKVHLLVKQVREHCNKRIMLERQKSLAALEVRPHKRFMALPGRYDVEDAKLACRAHGGHLAVVGSEEERRGAEQAVRFVWRSGLRFRLNAARPRNRHAMWMRPMHRPWVHSLAPQRCVHLKDNRLAPIACKGRQGALCEFLSFNPYVREVGRRVFLGVFVRSTAGEAQKRCAASGGRLATINGPDDQRRAASVIPKSSGPAYVDARATNFTAAEVGAHQCLALSRDRRWHSMACNRSLAVLCEARAVHDDRIRAQDHRAEGKFFVAFTNASWPARRQCWGLGARLARIRSNTQQLAALHTIARAGVGRILIDAVSPQPGGELRWSDGTRVAPAQRWRLKCRLGPSPHGCRPLAVGRQHCVSIDRRGEWRVEPCTAPVGVLCERPHPERAVEPFAFETEIRLAADFAAVTDSGATEAAFGRALEAEVEHRCREAANRPVDAVLVSMRKGSVVARVRVWTEGDGRQEAVQLQRAVTAGKFEFDFMGKMVRPTKGQRLPMKFSITICIFGPIRVNRTTLYVVAPTIVVVILTLVVALAVCLKKRKKQRRRVASVFTVKEEKELYLEEEDEKALPHLSSAFDPPPPYTAPLDEPPDYSVCTRQPPTLELKM